MRGAGGRAAILRRRHGGADAQVHPEGFLKVIQDERINWTFVAPTMLERVVGLPDEIKAKYNLSSMRTIICAAAPVRPR